MKLSIVIVNWNVRELLFKCLESLFLYAPKIPFEVCVIDNASHDGSVEMIQQRFKSVKCISNESNRGFGAACNQGFAATSGEYVLFLNPDTLLNTASLRPLIATLDEYEDVALVAPALKNSDGTIQQSVRRFPTPFKALLEFLRLSRPLETSLTTIAEIEQPMGACMLVRRSVLNDIGVFDERFFIWFEEVDLCRRIRDRGHKILFIPQAQVIHSGGQSFAQHPTLRKQKFFYKSYAQYLWKHWGWRSVVPVSLMKFYTEILSQPFFWVPLGVVAIAEALSLVGYFSDTAQVVGFWALTALVLLLSFRNLSFGIMAMVVELIIGSKGYLFSQDFGSFHLSLRMAFFLSIFIAWLYHCLRNKNQRFTFFKSKLAPWYALLGLFVVWGVVHGLLNNNGIGAIYKDANAWIYFLTVLPLYDAIQSRATLQKVLIVAQAAVTAQIIKIGIVLYVMTHKSFGVDVLYPFYRWIRETGIGEITQFEWGATRIFFQSNIYPLIVIFLLLPVLIKATQTHTTSPLEYIKKYWKQFSLLTGCIAVVLLSFSRSFWLTGALLMTGVLLTLLVRKKWKSCAHVLMVYGVSLVSALILVSTVVVIPIPPQTGGMGFDAFAKRFEDLDSEAAAASRWNLLPELRKTIVQNPLFGYGFGKTVTYTSFDPRVREKNKSGTFTTYSFEWGYLDFIVKMGIGGLLAFLGLLIVLAKTGLKLLDSSENTLIVGLLLGLAALSMVHVLTPYLNHPLGIGYIVFVGLIFELTQRKINT